MDKNMIYIIAGVAILLILIIALLIIRKNRKKKSGKNDVSKSKEVSRSEKEVVHSKYSGVEVPEEENSEISRLELLNFEDGLNALILRFEIIGHTIKIDDIEPYDNDWGFVHNYSEIIGQKRRQGQPLRLFFNRRIRKSAANPDLFDINIIYRDVEGKQWLQPLKYESNKGVEVRPVLAIADV